jgi:hypothetical protein
MWNNMVITAKIVIAKTATTINTGPTTSAVAKATVLETDSDYSGALTKEKSGSSVEVLEPPICNWNAGQSSRHSECGSNSDETTASVKELIDTRGLRFN